MLSPAAGNLFERILFSSLEKAVKNARSGIEFDPGVQIIIYFEQRFFLSTLLKAFCAKVAGSMTLVSPLAKIVVRQYISKEVIYRLS